jgi:hypothetical protein
LLHRSISSPASEPFSDAESIASSGLGDSENEWNCSCCEDEKSENGDEGREEGAERSSRSCSESRSSGCERDRLGTWCGELTEKRKGSCSGVGPRPGVGGAGDGVGDGAGDPSTEGSGVGGACMTGGGVRNVECESVL